MRHMLPAGFFLTAPASTIPETDAIRQSIYNDGNPTALINLVPERLVPVLNRVRKDMPRSIYGMERHIRKYCKPDERDQRLRLAFWDEYNTATAIERRMRIEAIVKGIIELDIWTELIEPDNKKMLWIFTPPQSYVATMRDIHDLCLKQMLKITKLPIRDRKGNADTKVITQILKIFQLTDMRIKGAIPQKLQIDQRTLTANVEQEQLISAMSLDELERLDRRISQAEHQAAKQLPAEIRQQTLDAIAEPPSHYDMPLPPLPNGEKGIDTLNKHLEVDIGQLPQLPR